MFSKFYAKRLKLADQIDSKGIIVYPYKRYKLLREKECRTISSSSKYSSCTRRGYSRYNIRNVINKDFDRINKERKRLDAIILSARKRKRNTRANIKRLKAEKERFESRYYSLIYLIVNNLIESEEKDEAERSKVNSLFILLINGFSKKDPFQSIGSLANLPDFDITTAFPLFDIADVIPETS